MNESSCLHQLDFGLPDVLRRVNIKGLDSEALVHSGGLLMFTNGDKRPINVEKLQIVAAGKMIRAASYGSAEANRPALVLTDEEQENVDKIRSIWCSILSTRLPGRPRWPFTRIASGAR